MQVALGTKMRWSSMVWGGGGGGSCGAVAQAVAAVTSGQANAVLVYRGLCQGQSRRFGLYTEQRLHGNFVYPFGLFAPPQMLALVVRRHMHLYGTSPESFAEVALSSRANANRNPHAVMHQRALTRDEYFSSRMIADPFRLYDCCLETDGACALIVTTVERARDLDARRIDIAAVAHGSGEGWSSGPLGAHNMPEHTYATSNGVGLAHELYAKAGITASEIDVAQIYDHFSGMVVLALEDFGFCERGAGSDFVLSGAIRWPNGSLPINTHGGNLSEAYVHGVSHIIEGVRQLRGVSTSQVVNAKTCLVTGGLGTSPTSALILRAPN